MTRDEAETHIKRIAIEPIYGVGFRAGLAGRSKRPPYEMLEERAVWDDGWQAGTAEAAKTGGTLAEWMSSERPKVGP